MEILKKVVLTSILILGVITCFADDIIVGPTGDIIVGIHLNYASENCEISLKYDNIIIKSKFQDCLKSWNYITFEDVEGITDLDLLTASALCLGPWGIPEGASTSTNFTYYPEENSLKNIDMNIDFIDWDWDFKYYKQGWNWLSYPRLPSRDEDGEYNSETLLESLIDEDPILRYFNNEEDRDEYVKWVFNIWEHDYLHRVHSTRGYKLHILNDRTHCITGDIENINETFKLFAGRENWIGCFDPNGTNIQNAFGEDWENVISIKSQEWYYRRDDINPNRDFGSTTPVASNDPTGKNFYYGKGYIIEVSEDILNFSWGNGGGIIPKLSYSDPQLFTYEEKEDYEAIDVVDLEPGIIEIGIFENGECIGATVVDSDSETILAYTEETNRSGNTLTLEVVYNNRTTSEPVKFSVYDKNSGEFYNRKLIARQSDHTIISLNSGKNDNIVDVYDISLLQNYPNPFNPETKIAYTIPEEIQVELSVYNLKGQKVINLSNGIETAGKHVVVWNGKDKNKNDVSSGVYFYKLSVGKTTIKRKMILIK